MKKWLFITFVVLLILSLCACSNMVDNKSTTDDITLSNSSVSVIDPVEQARQDVISKWKNEADVLGTARFIEDTYKKYPNDDVIANIYFYCIAKQQYDYYISLDNSSYLATAKEYATKIDPDYNGEFANEMHAFVKSLIPKEEYEEKHSNASSQEDKYNSLTNNDKKVICQYIQSRYDYYDTLNGGYAGDKYSDTIMEEAANKYSLSVSQIKVIWMNMYSY